MTRGSASMAAAHLACGMWLAHAAVVSAQHRAWPAAALMATAALVAATAAIREAAAARPVVVVTLPAEDRAALGLADPGRRTRRRLLRRGVRQPRHPPPLHLHREARRMTPAEELRATLIANALTAPAAA
ncbi:hypothetical protein [Streptomyces koyangensis]